MFDFSVAVVLPNCFPTLNASYHSQESGRAHDERLQRLHGVSIIHDAVVDIVTRITTLSGSDEDHSRAAPWKMDDDSYRRICLEVSSTACVLFHRFFHTPGGSIYEFDVWSLSMAAVLLATKIHDISVVSVRTIIHTFCSIYRQRILGADLSTLKGINSEHELGFASPPDSWNSLSMEERRRRLEETISLPTHGPVYLEWYNAIVSAECLLLHRLGYVVFWIPDHHAHSFVESFCQNVGIFVDPDPNSEGLCLTLDERSRILMREAYQFCRRASYIDLCVRYPPELICCATIQCAALMLHVELRSNHTQSDIRKGKSSYWWRDLWKMNSNELESMEKDINTIVAVITHVEKGSDYRIAARGHVPSKLPNNGSFNDPTSFVWEMLINRLASDS